MVNKLVFVFCLAQTLTAWGQRPALETTDTSTHKYPHIVESGTEFIFESMKVGQLHYSAASLNIVVRKSRDLSTNSIDKDVTFEGQINDESYKGYIDESEIDYALSSLVYVRDSLWTQKPADELLYIKNFSKSAFQIEAEFTPYNGALSKEWVTYLILDKNAPGSYVVLNKADLPSLMSVLQTAKLRLKTF